MGGITVPLGTRVPRLEEHIRWPRTRVTFLRRERVHGRGASFQIPGVSDFEMVQGLSASLLDWMCLRSRSESLENAYSAFIPLSLISFAHLSISSARKAAKSSGDPRPGIAP